MPRPSKSDLDAFARRLQDRRRVLIAEIREQMDDNEDEIGRASCRERVLASV